MSGVLSLLFLQGIRILSGVILARSYLCPDKIEKIPLSLKVSISVGFYILLLLLDKLVLGVDLDLSIELSVSNFFLGGRDCFLCLLFLCFVDCADIFFLK